MAGMLLLSLSYDDYRIAELQNCRIAELQNFGIAFFRPSSISMAQMLLLYTTTVRRCEMFNASQALAKGLTK